MAISKYKVNCSVCKKSRADAVFRNRLYSAYYEHDVGEESPTTIARDVGLSANSVMNHLKKHTRVNPITTPRKVETHVTRVRTQIQKEAELAFDHEEVIPREDYERVIDSILAEGLDQMKKQGKQISITQLIAAAKIKADYSLKKRGQDTEIIKTMYRMVSDGGNDARQPIEATPAEPISHGAVDTQTTGEVVKRGPGRPRSIHNQTPWDAAARGTKAVPTAIPQA